MGDDNGNANANANANGFRSKIEALKPAAGMVLVQAVLAGVNIFYKLALNDGMDAKVLVAYRYIFAAVFLCPLAYFLERNKRPALTWIVLFEGFCCALFGGTLSQNMYVESVKMTSATYTSAMTNLVPAITFILALLLRLEKLGIRTAAGQAKVVGTVVGLGGAMLLTFYKGPEINIWSTNINLLSHSHHQAQEFSNRVAGSILAIASCFSMSIWMIIQAKMTVIYPCYSTTALMCAMGSIQSVIVALCFNNQDWSQWKLGFDVRLLTVSYTGIVASGLIFSVMAWCIQQRGPLYASVFNPLMLVIVALLGSLLLNEKLHVGSIIGTILIIAGLYMVVWGKGREVVKVGDLASESARGSSVSIREPLDVVMVDGITISRSTSQSRNTKTNEIANSSVLEEP